MALALFTLILDFKGGTYIAQQEAIGPVEAVLSWAEALNEEGVEWAQAAASIDADKLVPLDDLKNAWCSSGVCDGANPLLNIVQTATGV